jgi:hypothetical protein
VANLETFKRGQVAWALWQVFSVQAITDPRRQEVPKAFTTRIRKFGELGIPLSDEERAGKPGIDSEYRSEQAFEIAVALDLQDIGLNQKEIAFFLLHVRDDLREVRNRIMKNPPTPRQNTGDDRTAFMLVHHVEAQEARNRQFGHPFFYEPIIVFGLDDLHAQMKRLGHKHRKMLVLELADLVVMVDAELAKAPAFKRGKQ